MATSSSPLPNSPIDLPHTHTRALTIHEQQRLPGEGEADIGDGTQVF